MLGYALTWPDCLERVVAGLYANDFTDSWHTMVFEAMSDWTKRNGDPEQIHDRVEFIFRKLYAARKLSHEETRTARDLAEMMKHCSFMQHNRLATVNYWMGVIKQASQRRAMLWASDQCIDASFDDEPLIKFEQTVKTVQSRAIHSVSGKLMGDTIFTTIDDMQAQSEGKSSRFLSTGIPSFDLCYGGLHRGDNIVLAGLTSSGKTALALSIARYLAKCNRSIVICSMEMTLDEIQKRLMAAETGIPLERLIAATFTPEERKQIAKFASDVSSWKLLIHTFADQSVSDIRSVCAAHKAKHGLDLVVVDYLQLIKADNPKGTPYEQTTQRSRSIQQMAKSLDCPVIDIVQFNRQYESDKGPPKLRHLKDSSGIEQDANVAILLHKPDHKSSSVEVIVEKNRQGQCGKLTLEFHGSTQTFSEPNAF